MYLWLQSPSGTSILLFQEEYLAAGANMNINFDDEATDAYAAFTPPYNMDSVTYYNRSFYVYSGFTVGYDDGLRAFDGEDSQGVWTLMISNSGLAGTLDAWSLNFNTEPHLQLCELRPGRGNLGHRVQLPESLWRYPGGRGLAERDQRHAKAARS